MRLLKISISYTSNKGFFTTINDIEVVKLKGIFKCVNKKEAKRNFISENELMLIKSRVNNAVTEGGLFINYYLYCHPYQKSVALKILEDKIKLTSSNLLNSLKPLNEHLNNL